ncbi:CMGC protein kinase [Aspergillus sclerotiicarbonarius CBS 121057]|uniref:CMGC protein kinase n=1 Tax=Aspergillus sclerotiicarbonarius (strain CBS 121057 / IBT 28362) TaxID=1448318 RepID=A0A319ENP8_ASPSB|nr:CMGC protein kinase [Aspergillus sclerotiicarbonarius CBS 121057]
MSSLRARLQTAPRKIPKSGFVTLEKVEEEKLPNYDPHNFYPVRIGEIFASKYQVASKLAYDTSSTTWLCRDIQGKAFFAIKICKPSPPIENELAISKHLDKADTSYDGRKYALYVLHSFEICAPDDTPFCCLVYPPFGINYTRFRSGLPDAKLPKEYAQRLIQFVLFSLDFMHHNHVIHTNVSANTILQGIVDYKTLARLDYYRSKHPAARKVSDDHDIYFSRAMPPCNSMPLLSDLGEARMGRCKHRGNIMSGIYPAPEVILDMEWDSKVDIWSIGTTLWTLVEGDNLFSAKKNGILNDEQHLAELVAIMGPPPMEFLRRSKKCQRFWDEQGTWKGSIPISAQSLEMREKHLAGEDKELFLNLLRKIFRWLPEERPTAEELVWDGFLMQGVDISIL